MKQSQPGQLPALNVAWQLTSARYFYHAHTLILVTLSSWGFRIIYPDPDPLILKGGFEDLDPELNEAVDADPEHNNYPNENFAYV